MRMTNGKCFVFSVKLLARYIATALVNNQPGNLSLVIPGKSNFSVHDLEEEVIRTLWIEFKRRLIGCLRHEFVAFLENRHCESRSYFIFTHIRVVDFLSYRRSSRHSRRW